MAPSPGLSRLVPFPDEEKDFIHRAEPKGNAQDIVLSRWKIEPFISLTQEFRQTDFLRRHGLSARSKLFFYGPPATDKTLCAEIFVSWDFSSSMCAGQLYFFLLGETASNIRKTFEFAHR